MSVKRERGRPLRVRSRTIASLQAGQVVNIRGRARPLGPLRKAPFSGRACLGWEARLSRDAFPDWSLRVIEQVTREVGDFWLVQNEHRVQVTCVDPLLDLAWPQSGVERGTPEGPRALRLGANPELRNLFFPVRGLVEWEERVLLPDDEVQMRAHVDAQPGAHANDDVGSYRDAPMQLILRAPPRRRLEIVVLES